ncbi:MULTISPECIES: nitrite reductase [Bacillati]|uniref:Nitrite reductase n=1 Tax=Niallia taxi TaxID=2499688 RepID=A0A437K7B8_9BACI|nr:MULTISPECIES: nitrite reductase [Niallia]MDK8643700.1 nitrite reductase [Niallia taxi]MED4041291.1 nitrite reductase [Niallia taxi]MED4057672.1 nitrite reductase [Niallia taxi]MED4122219.1 nitrite reductase [Niallia taxi]RVT59456.1 nitrite reductase [Niallia taxi]
MGAEKIKITVNGGIQFGARINARQLSILAKYLDENQEVELTTFQQIYLEIPKSNAQEIMKEFRMSGLSCYPVGNYVKSLRTCNFCKGSEEEGMPVAQELNRRVAGREVPFTLKFAYTGCPVGCGEPLVNDIGVMKIKDTYSLYIGGESTGKDAEIGTLLFKDLSPEQLYQKADKIIELYICEGKKREKFYKFVKRVGIDRIKESL